ncbi:transposable element Tc1 transposase [Trichonephila clavipes]|nr:transposable element Tc1 transposase [Trichonephila clavipes]
MPDSLLSTFRRVTLTLVSPMTLHRHLIEQTLRSYRPVRHRSLTPAHCRARLQWVLARSGWNHTDRGCIMFSDESRFQLCPDDHQRRVWRPPDQGADPAFNIASHLGPQSGVMVRGAIFFPSIRGILTEQRYVDDTLKIVLLPFLLLYPGLNFQQDNARPHTARVAMNCLSNCRLLSCPASNRACLRYDGKATASATEC